MEVARALIFEMHVPKTFLANAIQTAAFLMNRLPTCVLDYKSPIEVVSPFAPLFRIPPKVFGCICFVHVDKSSRLKLDPKALKVYFFGLLSNSKSLQVLSSIIW